MTDREPESPFAYVDELPRIGPGERFRFRCHPGVACFNACCADLDLVLSPYDVLRLRRSLTISGDRFIQQYGRIEAAADSGLPLVYLRMRDDAGMACPFVRERGCTVYDNRPGACRTYPLGRGTGLTSEGDVTEQYVVVREDHCQGFDEFQGEWTIESWLGDQGIEEFNRFNDLFLTLVDRFGRSGDPVRRSLAIPAVFALFQLDSFPERIKRERLFEKLEVSIPRRAVILADESERLRFAIGWAIAVLEGVL